MEVRMEEDQEWDDLMFGGEKKKSVTLVGIGI